jgi:mRNA interferase YafQ
MYSIRKTGQFKKDIKLCVKRGYDLSLLSKAMKLLMENGDLPEEYAMHPLKGKKYLHKTIYDAHISSDWILLFAFLRLKERNLRVKSSLFLPVLIPTCLNSSSLPRFKIGF